MNMCRRVDTVWTVLPRPSCSTCGTVSATAATTQAGVKHGASGTTPYCTRSRASKRPTEDRFLLPAPSPIGLVPESHLALTE